MGEYLDWLSHNAIEHVPIESHLTNTSARIPARQVSPKTMRALVYAIKHKQAIETLYASLNHPNGEPRIIHPHTFVKTGLRWHLRGYSEKHDGYRDFLLNRLSDDTCLDDTREYRPKGGDVSWNTQVVLVLSPNPILPDAQQQLIATDYSMVEGKLSVSTRGPLVHYLLQNMQIDVSQASNGAKQPLVVANLSEIQSWLFGENSDLAT